MVGAIRCFDLRTLVEEATLVERGKHKGFVNDPSKETEIWEAQGERMGMQLAHIVLEELPATLVGQTDERR